ncbi:glycoside hydrolase family 9 protein [Paenibacillus sp. MMS20-IR301]|uniref:glycoside hydrolase family 9 protein n=1 Tax=Paenibacillus sp. MMS20-IR301 TaxID=2895946 RepID=UPI0028E7D13F|nr:glycoside hydrolase family 9 protein [Paenibacillus sp. MMS20-IR301]WNS42346.1 glycoside hydrolase family 9 protein [Paenibacillus sp. MMS20-IR301]
MNRTKKASAVLLTFAIASSMLASPSLIYAEQTAEVNYLPPGGENWNKLLDINIKDSGWGYGNTVTQEVYQEQAARKIETNDWWADQLVVNGWQSFDFSAYANGALEFDIAGSQGGENFRIGFRDVVHERPDGNGGFYKDNDVPEETNIDALVEVGAYTEVTTEWQHVSIPLNDIFSRDPLFDASKIQLLKITGDNAPITFWISNIKVTSPDTERSYAPIKFNQVGYLGYGEKYANVSGYYNELPAVAGTPFQVRKVSDNSIAYEGTLSLVAAYDELSGEKVLKADFSALTENGGYYITVDGVDVPSAAFTIGADVYDSLLTDVQKFFYYQRANVDLLPEHAGEFARTGLHKIDANLPLQSNPAITKDVSGGWWDAGDTGKYVTAAATAVSDLLWAYENYPQEFSDSQLNIPESGNGIPDLLDEIKVETDFFLKMQDPASGGFYAYVIREPEPKRFIMDGTGGTSIIPTAQTATTAGALAHAYNVFKNVPGLEEYADSLLDSAVRAWDYLELHPEFIAQPDGPYNDNEDLNDRFYAAAALYRATGEARYNDFVLANYAAFETKFMATDFSHGIGSLELIGFYHYLSSAAPNEEITAWFVPKYKEWRAAVIDTATNQAVWRNSTNKGFYWGANSNVAGVAVSLDIGSRIIGEHDERNIQVASGNLNYLLGVNPLQLSFITGYGENRVHITHHEIYMRDFITEMPNGYMPGGPNNTGKFNFPAKAYNQATVDWESNEQALNYNSPLTYLTAMLSDVQNQTFSESIQLEGSTSGKLSVGQSDKITASVKPDNTTFKRLQAASADPGIATVSNVTYSAATGLTEFTVTAVKTGQTVIHVRSLDGRIESTYSLDVIAGNITPDPEPEQPKPGQPEPEPEQPKPGQPDPVQTDSLASTTIAKTAPGTATGVVSLSQEVLKAAASKAAEGKITIPVETASGQTAVSIEIPGDWIRTLDTAAVQSVSLEVLGSAIELDQTYLKNLFKDGAKKLSISISIGTAEGLPDAVRALVKDQPVYDLKMSVDTAPAVWSGQQVTVKLPYKLQAGEHASQVVVYNVDNGLEIAMNGLYDAQSEKMVFQPEHFSKYSVVYADVSFKDIDTLPAAAGNAIRAIAARGVIAGKGSGQYDPQGKLTRAEFVQMLAKFLDLPGSAAFSKFTDVKEGTWYYSAVASAEKLGIVLGRSESTFGPLDLLTRQEMAVLLHRALLISGHTLQQNQLPVSAFSDQTAISAYAQQPVAALKQAGIVSADLNGSYGPRTQADRAEAAAILYNFLLSSQ